MPAPKQKSPSDTIEAIASASSVTATATAKAAPARSAAAASLQTTQAPAATPGPASGAGLLPESGPEPVPAQVAKRTRGRPRKSALDLDEGNRRRQIINSAARLFRSKGFDAASTRDIAAGAGMQSGSPFYHFDNKHALLYVVMQEGMAHALQSQRAALAQLAPGAPPHAKLHALVRNHLEVLLGAHADFTPVMLYEWRSLDTAQSRSIAALKDAYEGEWAPVLDALHASGALQATPAVARLFVFGALNWSVQWYDPRGALSLDGLAEQAMGLFLSGR